MRTAKVLLFAVALVIWKAAVAAAQAQSAGTQTYVQYGEPPVMDNTIFYHLLFDQLEGRTNGLDNEFRWDGEGWFGTDMNKLWFKSEGFVEHRRMTDGDQEFRVRWSGKEVLHIALAAPGALNSLIAEIIEDHFGRTSERRRASPTPP